MFKAGDRVRLTDDWRNPEWGSVGDLATVQRRYGYTYIIKIDGLPDGWNVWHYDYHMLEKADV